MITTHTNPAVPLCTAKLGLFASDEMAIDTTFSAAHRIGLDAMSWVEHVPGWLTGSDQLLAALVAKAGWEQRDRWMVNRMVVEPRLTAEYPQLVDAPKPMLRTAAAALSEHYGALYDGLWINFYRNHRDSTGWHGDRPNVQAGDLYRAGAQPRCDPPVPPQTPAGRPQHRPDAAGGDLVVMGGRCQRDWRHCPELEAALTLAREIRQVPGDQPATLTSPRDEMPGPQRRQAHDPCRDLARRRRPARTAHRHLPPTAA